LASLFDHYPIEDLLLLTDLLDELKRRKVKV
jgi:hypothetical protein